MPPDDDTPPRTCTGCGATAPTTNSDFTLISSRFGWRIRRYMHHETPIAEWWCATCWADLKKAGGGVASLVVSVPPKKP